MSKLITKSIIFSIASNSACVKTKLLLSDAYNFCRSKKEKLSLNSLLHFPIRLYGRLRSIHSHEIHIVLLQAISPLLVGKHTCSRPIALLKNQSLADQSF